MLVDAHFDIVEQCLTFIDRVSLDLAVLFFDHGEACHEQNISLVTWDHHLMMCACHHVLPIVILGVHHMRATDGMIGDVLVHLPTAHNVEELTTTTDADLDLLVSASIEGCDIFVVSHTIVERLSVLALTVQSRMNISTRRNRPMQITSPSTTCQTLKSTPLLQVASWPCTVRVM